MYRTLGAESNIAVVPYIPPLPKAPATLDIPIGPPPAQEAANVPNVISWENLPGIQQALYTPPPGYTIVGQQQPAVAPQQQAPVVSSGVTSLSLSEWLNTGNNKLIAAAVGVGFVVLLTAKKRRR